MRKIRIKETDIFLENFDKGQGKITVSNTYGYNFSYYWGSMGDTLEKFLCDIDSDYFSSKLMGYKSGDKLNVKSTFSSIRKFLKEEIYGLAWYNHMEFQKDMREQLRRFQNNCEDCPEERYFVDEFFRFINSLDYDLINDKYDRKSIEGEIKGISEPWHFICKQPNEEYLFLKDLHKHLKNSLTTNNRTNDKESENKGL